MIIIAVAELYANGMRALEVVAAKDMKYIIQISIDIVAVSTYHIKVSDLLPRSIKLRRRAPNVTSLVV